MALLSDQPVWRCMRLRAKEWCGGSLQWRWSVTGKGGSAVEAAPLTLSPADKEDQPRQREEAATRRGRSRHCHERVCLTV
jgi:hypothetical protein